MIKLFEQWINERVKVDPRLKKGVTVIDQNQHPYEVVDYIIPDNNVKKTLDFHEKHSDYPFEELGYETSDLQALKGHILVAATDGSETKVAPIGGKGMKNPWGSVWFELDKEEVSGSPGEGKWGKAKSISFTDDEPTKGKFLYDIQKFRDDSDFDYAGFDKKKQIMMIHSKRPGRSFEYMAYYNAKSLKEADKIFSEWLKSLEKSPSKKPSLKGEIDYDDVVVKLTMNG